MIKRKVISIFLNKDIEPSVCITYFSGFGLLENECVRGLRFWVNDFKIKDSWQVTHIAYSIMRNITKRKCVKEKNIFAEIKKIVREREFGMRYNYQIGDEYFNTTKMGLVKKPFRDFSIFESKDFDNILEKETKKITLKLKGGKLWEKY